MAAQEEAKGEEGQEVTFGMQDCDDGPSPTMTKGVLKVKKQQ